MKKVLLVIMVLVLSLAFVACGGSSYDKIKAAFEKEGYSESQDLESAMTSLKEALEEDELSINVHYLYKLAAGGGAFVIEFKSTDDMKKALADNPEFKTQVEGLVTSDDAKELYDEAVEAGIVNGNCICIPFGLAPATYIEIFKNA